MSSLIPPHVCKMVRIHDSRFSTVSDFVYFTKCGFCMRMCFKCDICGDIVDSSGYYSENRCHINHLLTHYGIELPSTLTRNFLPGSYGENKWHVSYYHVVRRFPQIRLLQPIICMKTLGDFLYEQINSNDWNRDYPGQISVNIINYLYDSFLSYMMSCSFECSLCEFIYETLPTMDIVLSHCVSNHDIKLNSDGLPPLKEFIIMSAGKE